MAAATAWTLGSLLLLSSPCQAFVPPSLVGTLSGTTATTTIRSHASGPIVARRMLPPAVVDVSTNTMTLAEEVESWRQYVPLVVSILVITDILLGSPAANAVLSIARPKEGDGNDNNDGARAPSLGSLLGGAPQKVVKDSKERVDTMAVAQAALDKAAATQDLRKFLDESKSDMEKMRDVQKKLDEQLAAFDQKQLEKKEGE